MSGSTEDKVKYLYRHIDEKFVSTHHDLSPFYVHEKGIIYFEFNSYRSTINMILRRVGFDLIKRRFKKNKSRESDPWYRDLRINGILLT